MPRFRSSTVGLLCSALVVVHGWALREVFARETTIADSTKPTGTPNASVTLSHSQILAIGAALQHAQQSSIAAYGRRLMERPFILQASTSPSIVVLFGYLLRNTRSAVEIGPGTLDVARHLGNGRRVTVVDGDPAICSASAVLQIPCIICHYVFTDAGLTCINGPNTQVVHAVETSELIYSRGAISITDCRDAIRVGQVLDRLCRHGAHVLVLPFLRSQRELNPSQRTCIAQALTSACLQGIWVDASIAHGLGANYDGVYEQYMLVVSRTLLPAARLFSPRAQQELRLDDFKRDGRALRAMQQHIVTNEVRHPGMNWIRRSGMDSGYFATYWKFLTDFLPHVNWQREVVFEIGPGHSELLRIIALAGASASCADLDPGLVLLARSFGFNCFVADSNDIALWTTQQVWLNRTHTGVIARGLPVLARGEQLRGIAQAIENCLVDSDRGWSVFSPYFPRRRNETNAELQSALSVMVEGFLARGWLATLIRSAGCQYALERGFNCPQHTDKVPYRPIFLLNVAIPQLFIQNHALRITHTRDIPLPPDL